MPRKAATHTSQRGTRLPTKEFDFTKKELDAARHPQRVTLL